MLFLLPASKAERQVDVSSFSASSGKNIFPRNALQREIPEVLYASCLHRDQTPVGWVAAR